MRIAHFADVHLGYRAYPRTTSSGLNQREVDVEAAFADALRKIRDLDPDLILMAGDLFHSVRPSNYVLHRTFRMLRRLREQCRAPIVMIAGNHESPRSMEAGCVLRLFDNIDGIVVRDAEASVVRIDDCSILCLPHRSIPGIGHTPMVADATAAQNLLMLHGTLEGIGSHVYEGAAIRRADILGDSWDYIALGHYHIHTQVAANAYYSGSTEYTSFNPWEEIGKQVPPKGFLLVNTDRRTVEHHRVQTREMVDVPGVHGAGLTALEIMERIESALATVRGGLKEKVVRLRVFDVPRKVQIDLDRSRLRALRMEALHLEISIRPPGLEQRSGEGGRDGARRTLEQEWDEHVDQVDLPGGLERAELKRTGHEYLARVAQESRTDAPPA